MIAIQLGIILFLVFIFAIVLQDEYKKRRLSRKSVKSERFWQGGKERRKYVRINTQIGVLYEIAAGRAAQKQNSVSRNISVGGVNLALKEKLAAGTVLSLELSLPQGQKPITVAGRIVWVKELPAESDPKQEERVFATGIEFIRLNPADEVILRDYVNQHIKEAPEEITPYVP